MTERNRRGAFIFFAAVAGVISALVFLAAAELSALLVARDSSPLLAVGSFVIDVVPQPLKEFAISTFGEFDKIALLLGLGLAVLIASAGAGMLQLFRPPTGVIMLGIAGAACVAATTTRAGATPLAFLPSVIGAVAGAVVLVLLCRRPETNAR